MQAVLKKLPFYKDGCLRPCALEAWPRLPLSSLLSPAPLWSSPPPLSPPPSGADPLLPDVSMDTTVTIYTHHTLYMCGETPLCAKVPLTQAPIFSPLAITVKDVFFL